MKNFVANFVAANGKAVEAVQNATVGGFVAVGTQFVLDSIQHMIPWLIVSLAVIVCDLVCGIRQSYLMKEEVRFSRAMRRTMGKIVTYFSFVVCVVLVNDASGASYKIDMWACLFVCFVELCSIISNLLRPKGIDFNVVKVVAIFLSNAFKVDKEDVEDALTAENGEKGEDGSINNEGAK